MLFQLQKLRERLADVNYEIEKETNKILFLQEQVQSRLQQKEEMAKHKFKWENTYQLGLEQTELEIVIREAVKNKLINEIKFLRLDIDSLAKVDE
jgi:hypothetical protein